MLSELIVAMFRMPLLTTKAPLLVVPRLTELVLIVVLLEIEPITVVLPVPDNVNEGIVALMVQALTVKLEIIRFVRFCVSFLAEVL